MKQFKLRGWDAFDKKMYYFDLLEYITYNECYQEKICSYDAMKNLMRFTGLRDKNEKDIFEGDIVKGSSRMQEDWILEQPATFLNGCFMFGNWNAHEYFNKHTEIEIVGNIHEGTGQ